MSKPPDPPVLYPPGLIAARYATHFRTAVTLTDVTIDFLYSDPFTTKHEAALVSRVSLPFATFLSLVDELADHAETIRTKPLMLGDDDG